LRQLGTQFLAKEADAKFYLFARRNLSPAWQAGIVGARGYAPRGARMMS
jgi:hypothetical protein